MLESAESEHPTLTNGEIILEEFQTYVIMIPQRHGQTDRWTNRRLCRSNTALCITSCSKYIPVYNSV